MSCGNWKWKLLSSAPGVEGVMDSIKKFYCGEDKTLRPVDRGANVNATWYIVNSDGSICEGVRVIQKGLRTRFEMKVEK